MSLGINSAKNLKKKDLYTNEKKERREKET